MYHDTKSDYDLRCRGIKDKKTERLPMIADQNIQISYCTNIHPGETYQDLMLLLSTHVKQVESIFRQKQQAQATKTPQSFPIGLRLGAQTLAEVQVQKSEFLRRLRDENLSVYSVNAFPYGNFAKPGLKQGVYLPNWGDDLRLSYTQNIADLLSQMPGPKKRSISTLSGAFITRQESATELKSMRKKYAQQMIKLGRYLEDLEDQTQVQIQLAIEAEPWTTLETIDQCIAFFVEDLWPLGSDLKRYFGICYDTCHQAVMFENEIENLKKLAKAKVPIAKMQVSNAIAVRFDSFEERKQKQQALLAFDESVYLHQICAYKDGKRENMLDLPLLREALNAQTQSQEALFFEQADEWRCHFHVPLFWQGNQLLSSTYTNWQEAVRFAMKEKLCEQFEVETYTWFVLPKALQESGLYAGIAQELKLLESLIYAG